MNEAIPLKIWLERDGALLRLRLAKPKANIIDAAMIGAMGDAFDHHLGHGDLRGVLIDAEGPNFSFGASVEEHLPGNCAEMLRALHALILRMVRSPVPILVAIRGQCLGGGLEVAAAGHLLFASHDAKFGQPEISLAVFAPAASCLLPARIGQANAEDLLFSGRSVDAGEARALGLVNQVAEDPEVAAVHYFETHLLPHSAAALRFAVKAARLSFADELEAKLEAVEALYLGGLMETRDAVEGLNAFLERRPAKWENR